MTDLCIRHENSKAELIIYEDGDCEGACRHLIDFFKEAVKIEGIEELMDEHRIRLEQLKEK
jgi:hypothetical protein